MLGRRIRLSSVIAIGALLGVSISAPAQASVVNYDITFDFTNAGFTDVVGHLAVNSPPVTYPGTFSGATLQNLIASFSVVFTNPADSFSCAGNACVSNTPGFGGFTGLTFDSSGALTAIGAFINTGGNNANDANTLEIGASGTFTGTGLFFRLNPVGSGSSDIVSGITIAQAVPEPSTWAMIILGFAGLGFMASRRKNGRGSFRWA
jgi:hypothetical protein